MSRGAAGQANAMRWEAVLQRDKRSLQRPQVANRRHTRMEVVKPDCLSALRRKGSKAGPLMQQGTFSKSGLNAKHAELRAFQATFRTKHTVSMRLRLAGGGYSHERTLLRLNSC
jgi:hypothetical protein